MPLDKPIGEEPIDEKPINEKPATVSVSQLIDTAKAKYDAMKMLTLAEIDALRFGPISMEEKAALSRVHSELSNTINRVTLDKYLAAVGVAEEERKDYSYDGCDVIYSKPEDIVEPDLKDYKPTPIELAEAVDVKRN